MQCKDVTEYVLIGTHMHTRIHMHLAHSQCCPIIGNGQSTATQKMKREGLRLGEVVGWNKVASKWLTGVFSSILSEHVPVQSVCVWLRVPFFIICFLYTLTDNLCDPESSTICRSKKNSSCLSLCRLSVLARLSFAVLMLSMCCYYWMCNINAIHIYLTREVYIIIFPDLYFLKFLAQQVVIDNSFMPQRSCASFILKHSHTAHSNLPR